MISFLFFPQKANKMETSNIESSILMVEDFVQKLTSNLQRAVQEFDAMNKVKQNISNFYNA